MSEMSKCKLTLEQLSYSHTMHLLTVSLSMGTEEVSGNNWENK